jgi:uncharacterized protein DUF4234
MAEMVTVDEQQYMKRDPLGVLGLSILTLGVYFAVWYYKINDELRRAEDENISPGRSTLAITLGWLIIVPPFIAMYNTAKHVQSLEARRGSSQTVEPALTVALMLVVGVANGPYIQEHLNRAWEGTTLKGKAAKRPAPATSA